MHKCSCPCPAHGNFLQISSRTQDLELQIQGYIAKGQICKLMTVGKSKWTGMTKFATIAIYTITTKCYICCTNVLCDIGTILYHHDPIIVTKLQMLPKTLNNIHLHYVVLLVQYHYTLY